MGGVLAVLMILLIIIFANFGVLLVAATRISKFSQFDSSFNITLEDKRGIPSGANPLHNR